MAHIHHFRGFLIIAIIGTLLHSGCMTGGSLNLPSSHSVPFKEYKDLVIRSHWPHFKESGIFLKEGDLYSVIVTGKINTNPKQHPSRWQGPQRRLMMMTGNLYYGPAPVNGTREAKENGEIKFYVQDGDFDIYGGKAYHPEWYKDNRGSFRVTIFVWKKNETDSITSYLRDLTAANPDNDAVKSTYEQNEIFKEYYLARIETQKEVEKTKTQLGALKQTPPVESQPSSTNFTEKMGSAALLATERNTKDAQIANLEAKLTKLTATLAKLEDLQQQLEAEKQKSARLAQELESTKVIAEEASADRLPPYLLVASPKDGMITAAARVTIAGVAEDDIGLQNVEIRINDRLLDDNQMRGIMISGDHPVKRHEFDAQVPIVIGRSEITIRAIDTDGQVTEKRFVVKRHERSRNIWSVVVGIDKYASVPRLKYAVKDARAFYNLLTDVNQIPKENVTLLTNEQATLTNLRSLLGTRLKQNAGKGDMVIIYFAGHGATERDVTSPDGDGLEKYILPYDANPKDLYASALPMREISHILNRIQSERLVFIADACYSGASGGRTISIEGLRSNLSDNFFGRISRGKGRVIITASGANEVSAEDDALEHGVFTYYLIEGLKGRADYDADGLITVDEAYRYVSDAVPRATNQDQHPVKMGAVEGQLVLGVAN
jgi:hypothetical protein